MPHKLNDTSASNSTSNHHRYSPPSLAAHNNSNASKSDASLPEKEPVEFDVSHLRGAPAEVETLVHNIKQVAQQFLYHWRTFPIVLPGPLATVCNDQVEDSCGPRRRKYHLKDLFVAPNFDELDAVAVDIKGEPTRLTNKQLESIREKGLHKDKYGKPKKLNFDQLESIKRCGEFEVDSINFPGQTHRWRLSGLLQLGRDRRRETLLKDLALAARFIVITAKGRLLSHCFSVSQSLKAFLTGILRLLDIIFGIPSLQAQNLDSKLKEERCRYLVAELVCKSEYEDSVEVVCGFVHKQLRRAKMEKFEVERESSELLPVPVPFVFVTPSGASVDLRLYNKEIIKKALAILVEILEKESRGWFLHFRERLISELRAQKKTDEEIEREVNKAVIEEYLQRVYSSIMSHPNIASLGEGINRLLVQQAQSVVLMHRAVENVQRRLTSTKEELRRQVEQQHPVLSRIEPWMRDKMYEAEANFIEQCEWSAHEEALSLCSQHNLQQTVYFLNRDLTFMKEREPVLLKELRKVKTPTQSFQWPTQIWFPANWIVRRSFQGQSEIIPTVLSNTPTSITTPRADPNQPVFLVEREIVHTTTTRWPMWRWINFIARTWCWTWNAMFLLGIAVPWCSPVSFRALLLTQPFTPDLELSQVNGTLFPRKSTQTPTLCSRLTTLWRHISKSRTHFESEPDTGFIGKGLTRHINRLWNYGVKGFLGTLCILFVFPVICIVVSFGSLFLALTAILWMPLITLTLHAFMVLCLDLDTPDDTRNRCFVIAEALIWNIGIQGCVQPIVALFVATIVCPIISFTILTVAVIRYWFRVFWDNAMFHLVIKKRGRVPASDSFVAKRIAGPGLASDYFFQIQPEQALAVLEAKVELDELLAFQMEMERLINQPQKDFTQFVEACFGPFATNLAKNKEPYNCLEKEAQELVSVLHEKLDRRRKELQTGLSVAVRSKIKLTTYDLKVVIQQGALMLKRLYPSHVLCRLNMNEEEFWENRSLGQSDWPGLADMIFAEIFHLNFLQPLNEYDTRFKLEPHPGVDLSRYTDMLLHNTDLASINGLDLLGTVYAPRGKIQVHSPYLEVSVFNPRAKPSNSNRNSARECETSAWYYFKQRDFRTMSSHGKSSSGGDVRWQPWKRQMRPYSADKLLIPLPIPHPVHIAVTIHNRDSEDPIPLDSELCQNILWGIEESAVGEMATAESINRFRSSAAAADSSFDSVASQSSISIEAATEMENNDKAEEHKQSQTYHWTLSNWGGVARTNSGSVKVDLASPEDVTLDTDTTRVMFSTYGTTV